MTNKNTNHTHDKCDRLLRQALGLLDILYKEDHIHLYPPVVRDKLLDLVQEIEEFYARTDG